jgi:hypothetical protein
MTKVFAQLSIVALLVLATINAQEFRSTMSGRVTDPTGAVVAGAKVTATETETGTNSATTSSAEGSYTLPFLTPGQYRIIVEAPGFKKYQQDQIQIGTNQRVALDVKLELGSQTESVTVTADVSLLQTATASVGQVITTRQIESTPMNGRTPLTLAQLAYGVTPASDPRFTRPFDNGGPSGFSMGGGQGQSNELLLDGAPDTTGNRRVAFNPPVDSVAEVKVEAFQPDAAYGNTGGGTVNVVLKSGTNNFHGSAYNFHQNNELTGVPFFTKAAGGTNPISRYNQYGGSIGGPVWIPKLYNGKNRLFFFYTYEGIRQSTPEPTFATVPTEAQRAGNLSNLLAVGATYQIYDPATARTEGARIRRDPFPNNVIPGNRINTISRNILGYIPGPNTVGRADGVQNFFSNANRSDVFFSHMGRMDFNASDNHKMFYSIRNNDRVENRGNVYNNIITGNNLSRVNWGMTFDDVYTLTPTLIWNTRLNWTRFIEGNIRDSDGFDFTSLGFPASLASNSQKFVFPQIDFNNFSDVGATGGDRTPFDSYQIFSTMTKVLNKHSVKFGVDLRRTVEHSNGFGRSSGGYVFGTNWTRGPLDTAGSAPLGQDLAAFLLGLPTGGSFDITATRTQGADYYSFFVQDDWRVRNNLTFNVGLRFETETGTSERFNRTVAAFDPQATLGLTAAARTAYAANPSPLLPASSFNPVGGVVFASDDRPKVYNPPFGIWSPRFGFSWQPNLLGSKTVVRGGIGFFYSTFGSFGISQPGFSQSTPYVASLDNFLTPANTLSNPFPVIQQPVGNSLGVNTFLGQSVSYVQPNTFQPRTVRWNFNIQRELGQNLVMELGYIGSTAYNLSENRNINFIPNDQLSGSLIRDQATIDRLAANVRNPFQNLIPGTGLNGSTTSQEQLLRPYPQFSGEGGVQVQRLNTGYSDFHMLLVRLEKRFAKGFSVLGNYQWSKFMEATGRLYAAAPELEYRIAGEDRPHRFVLSGNWELPVGRGKALLGGVGPWTNRLLGGWQVSGIYNSQSGAAVGWGNIIYFGGDLKWDPRNLTNAFDVTRFERVPGQQLGSNRRWFGSGFTTYRNDRVNNVDASLIKNTAITEKVNIQLRTEVFNVFNRFQFNGPDTNPTSTNFGRITSTANLPRTLQLALRLVF